MSRAEEHDLEQLIQTLEQTGDYRIFRRYQKPDSYHYASKDIPRLAAFIDVETTGLDWQKDKIIEFAAAIFEFDPKGRIYRIVGEYQAFEDPKRPLSQDIIELTGISDDMLEGQRFDESELLASFDGVALIIAHNAGFDRRFVEKRFPQLADKAWACSINDVDWRAEGLSSAKLELLAYHYKFFFNGHRALDDCLASVHILAQDLPASEGLVLKKLLANARKTTIKIEAKNAPFESKDVLKARGYRWNGNKKTWWTNIPEDAHAAEMNFLSESVYHYPVNFSGKKLSAYERYSVREET